jgi:hypothetical protein
MGLGGEGKGGKVTSRVIFKAIGVPLHQNFWQSFILPEVLCEETGLGHLVTSPWL